MSETQHFKDYHRETRIFWARLAVMSVLMLALMGVLVYRYHHLQVVQYQDYATQSDRNRIHVQPIPPTRGLIYDRNGLLLAENRPSYTLSVVRERAGDLEETLKYLQTLVEINANDLEKFYKLMHQRRRPFEPVPLRYNLTEEELASLAVNEFRLEGVEIDAQLVRHYPYGELFAHTVGYVGRISEAELTNFDEDQYRRYSGTHSIGKTGLERLEHYPKLKARIEQHIEETYGQQKLLRACIERLGSSPSTVKDLSAKLVAFGQSVSGMMVSDEVVKGAMSGYVFEHMEIASYTILIAAAKAVGDVETQRACEQILPQEIAMAEWLKENLPELTQAFLARSAADDKTAKR